MLAIMGQKHFRFKQPVQAGSGTESYHATPRNWTRGKALADFPIMQWYAALHLLGLLINDQFVFSSKVIWVIAWNRKL
jgi:hypothetical protein